MTGWSQIARLAVELCYNFAAMSLTHRRRQTPFLNRQRILDPAYCLRPEVEER